MGKVKRGNETIPGSCSITRPSLIDGLGIVISQSAWVWFGFRLSMECNLICLRIAKGVLLLFGD